MPLLQLLLLPIPLVLLSSNRFLLVFSGNMFHLFTRAVRSSALANLSPLVFLSLAPLSVSYHYPSLRVGFSASCGWRACSHVALCSYPALATTSLCLCLVFLLLLYFFLTSRCVRDCCTVSWLHYRL